MSAPVQSPVGLALPQPTPAQRTLLQRAYNQWQRSRFEDPNAKKAVAP